MDLERNQKQPINRRESRNHAAVSVNPEIVSASTELLKYSQDKRPAARKPNRSSSGKDCTVELLIGAIFQGSNRLYIRLQFVSLNFNHQFLPEHRGTNLVLRAVSITKK
jgi:hypothetical protein